MSLTKKSKIIEFIKDEIDRYINDINISSFDMGLPGSALFYYYYSKYSNNEEYYSKFITLINRSIENLSKLDESSIRYKTDSIDNHLAGFGRFLIFSQYRLSSNLNFDNILDQLDELLLPLMYSKINNKDFDFNSGALAAGYYFVARYAQSKSSTAQIALQDLVIGIKENAKENENGMYWTYPLMGDMVYLGISHGSAMIANFLSNVLDMGLCKQLIPNIIISCIDFLLSNKRDQVDGIFPHCYLNNDVRKTQFSLCYGDLGIGYAITKAGSSINNINYYDEGINILLQCAQRKKEIKYTRNGGMIYGAAGIACVFDEIQNFSNNSNFRKAQRYWLEAIESYVTINKKDQITFENINVSNDNLENYLSFDWGLSGVGTTLIKSSFKKKYPSFNELTLISSYYKG